MGEGATKFVQEQRSCFDEMGVLGLCHGAVLFLQKSVGTVHSFVVDKGESSLEIDSSLNQGQGSLPVKPKEDGPHEGLEATRLSTLAKMTTDERKTLGPRRRHFPERAT